MKPATTTGARRCGTGASAPPDFAVFRIDPSRGSQVLLELLGPDYAGTLICDFFSAYRKFLALTPCVLQFCQAHLIRDIAFLETLSHRPGIRWAGKLLELFRKLFRKHHQRLAQPHKSFAKSLDNIRRAILALVAPPRPNPRPGTFRSRFPHVQAGVLHVPRVAAHRPDQQLHRAAPCGFAVIDRKLTQGTRGTAGQTWCQRVWSVLATCRIQDRSAFLFLAQSIACAFKRMPTPQLLPAGP